MNCTSRGAFCFTGSQDKFSYERKKKSGREGRTLEQAKLLVPGNQMFEDLYFCGGGRSSCFPGHSFGPDVRLNYLIHYIISGKGIFETDSRRYLLSQGQGFLIEPGVSTFYQADDKEPWNYLWINFNGSLAGQIVRELGIRREHPVFSCQEGPQLEEIFNRLFEASGSGMSLYQHSQLLAFLHKLASRPEASQGGDGFVNRANYHIDRALVFIRANYSNRLQVSDMANYLGISRNYLFTLFYRHMGQSPQEYLSSFRLGCARELLTTTDYSIGEIALLCGYQNVNVFSAAFKRKYLISPSLFQKYSQEHPEINPTEYALSVQKKENP